MRTFWTRVLARNAYVGIFNVLFSPILPFPSSTYSVYILDDQTGLGVTQWKGIQNQEYWNLQGAGDGML